MFSFCKPSFSGLHSSRLRTQRQLISLVAVCSSCTTFSLFAVAIKRLLYIFQLGLRSSALQHVGNSCLICATDNRPPPSKGGHVSPYGWSPGHDLGGRAFYAGHHHPLHDHRLLHCQAPANSWTVLVRFDFDSWLSGYVINFESPPTAFTSRSSSLSLFRWKHFSELWRLRSRRKPQLKP